MISDMVRHQFDNYWICIAAGLGAGVFGGLLNMAARLLGNSQVVVWICDIVLWLVLSVTVVAVNYICCDGTLRLYIFLGFFSGFLLSYCTINWGTSKVAIHILYHKQKDSENVKM